MMKIKSDDLEDRTSMTRKCSEKQTVRFVSSASGVDLYWLLFRSLEPLVSWTFGLWFYFWSRRSLVTRVSVLYVVSPVNF